MLLSLLLHLSKVIGVEMASVFNKVIFQFHIVCVYHSELLLQQVFPSLNGAMMDNLWWLEIIGKYRIGELCLNCNGEKLNLDPGTAQSCLIVNILTKEYRRFKPGINSLATDVQISVLKY
jgi:hypothetical protein